jgi:hypothetical protein
MAEAYGSCGALAAVIRLQVVVFTRLWTWNLSDSGRFGTSVAWTSVAFMLTNLRDDRRLAVRWN